MLSKFGNFTHFAILLSSQFLISTITYLYFLSLKLHGSHKNTSFSSFSSCIFVQLLPHRPNQPFIFLPQRVVHLEEGKCELKQELAFFHSSSLHFRAFISFLKASLPSSSVVACSRGIEHYHFRALDEFFKDSLISPSKLI